MEEFKIEKKEKPPPVLYIGAQVAGIKELTPMRGRHRDENEGAVIFATPDKAYASAFLVEGHGDHWMQIGFYSDVLVVVINSDRDEFISRDKGGIMYSVSSEKFNYDPKQRMGDKEWTSREPVKPLSETRYSSALNAMIENGVQVYFVDRKTFDSIQQKEDKGCSILANLTSENQKQGKNIRPLKDLDW